MARTALDIQRITRDGLDPTYEAANSDGNSAANDGHVYLHVKNGDTAQHTVTVVSTATVHGLGVADQTIDVAAGGEAIAGPFPPATFSRDLTIDYSATTSMTVAALKG